MRPTTFLRMAALPSLAGLALSAQACETLQAEIDAKIRASGASNFSLVAVDAEAPVDGRVVGTCGLGRKKIVYTPAVGSATGASGSGSTRGGSGLRTTGTLNAPVVRAATPPPPAVPPVLTECKPGYTGADCSRRIGAATPPAAAPAKPAATP
jgi:Protein of unknown function (DUF1161)